MKGRGFIVFVGLIGIITFACKKDITPVVTYTVVDTTGATLENAKVYTHPCFDGVSCDTSRINENFIKIGLTDSKGKVTFGYPYSAIIDVIADWTDCDTTDSNAVWCMYAGRTVARFETIRTSEDDENLYDVRVVVKKIQ